MTFATVPHEAELRMKSNTSRHTLHERMLKRLGPDLERNAAEKLASALRQLLRLRCTNLLVSKDLQGIHARAMMCVIAIKVCGAAGRCWMYKVSLGRWSQRDCGMVVYGRQFPPWLWMQRNHSLQPARSCFRAEHVALYMSQPTWPTWVTYPNQGPARNDNVESTMCHQIWESGSRLFQR